MERSGSWNKFFGGGGVYKIQNIINKNIYIGSSNDIVADRWVRHIKMLNSVVPHYNPHLQNAWNKYGQNSFEFSVVEECLDCSKTNLHAREQHYMDTLNPEYNIAKVAGSPPAQVKPVNRINLENGEIKEYAAAADAEIDGFEGHVVGSVCRGDIASHRNYGWEFADGSSPEFKGTWDKVFYPTIRIAENGEEKLYLTFAELESDGFTYRKVKACCEGKYGRRSHNGYTWRFRDEMFNKIAVETTDTRTPEIYFRPVIRIDSAGIEKHYISTAAVELDGFNQRSVGKVCRGEGRSQHKGYRWKFADGSSPEFVAKGHGEKRIAQIDMATGDIVKIYDYIKQVKVDGFTPSAVCCCAKGSRPTHKGFFWQYV